MNEENIIDEKQLPVIHEGEVSAAALSSPEESSDATELSNHVEATSDEVQASLMDEGEVSRVADSSTVDKDEPSCSGDAAVAIDTVSHTPVTSYIKLM